MLNSAGRRTVLSSLRLESPRAIRSYNLFTYPPTLKPSGFLRQLWEAQPVWQRSFTTRQTPTDKLRNAISKARNDHPFLFPTLLIASFASVCWLALLSYDEFTRENPKLGAFSPAVERHLRNAIWYTEIKPEPSVAADSFSRAIEQAEREGMDPVSPEFTGIHIRFAAALEKFGQAKGAVKILGRLVDDLFERIEDIDRGQVTQRIRRTAKSSESGAQGFSAHSITGTSPEARETERGRLLKQVIECKVKISQLYASNYIQDDAAAKRVIDEAMKILIEAMRDPKSLRFDENRAGISADEAAAMLSSAGESNILWGNFGTALEIFKLALIAVHQTNKGKPSCREAFTLSNMAAAVSLMLDDPSPVIDGKPATKASIKQARHILAGWAQQSLQCAQAVEGPERDNLCNMAVMTSWSHMAGTLKELGDLNGARRMWEQVIDNSASQTELNPLVSIALSELHELDEGERRR